MLMTPANDVATSSPQNEGKHPKVSNNNIKNPDAYLKGKSLCFYIVPGEPVVVASAVVFYYPSCTL